jgi:hypothetical protein
MKKATEELENEHRIIERVVAAMAVLAEKLQSGKKIQSTVWPDLLEFLPSSPAVVTMAKRRVTFLRCWRRKVCPSAVAHLQFS